MGKRWNIWKITLACFISGALGTVIGLLVRPSFCFLGTIAGAVTGYLAYDFREVLKAIPEALQRSNASFCRGMDGLIAWRKQRHPLVYSSFIVAYIVAIQWGPSMFERDRLVLVHEIASLLAFLAFLGLVWFFAIVATFIVLAIGFELHGEEQATRRKFFGVSKEDSFITPMTYGEFFKWVFAGCLSPLIVVGWLIVHVIRFFLYDLWVKFVPALVRLVHSTERMCCGCYGALGGTIAFLYGIFLPDRTPMDVAFLAVFGGLLGVFGGTVIGRKLLSRRSGMLPQRADS
jgi:hypothetical protein